MRAPTVEVPAPERGGEFVQSLARGLDVITAFDATHRELTLTEVAARTGLTRATARRFLHTLVALGYVHVDGPRFRLTPRVLRLGYAFVSGLPLSEIAQPHLKDLSARLLESTSVSVLDGTDILYVVRVHTHRIMAMPIPVGTRFPAHATSMGRVLLAHLPDDELDAHLGHALLERLTPYTITDLGALRAELARVREQGYAVADQQLALGLRSVAVPVRQGERVVAAANVSMALHDGRSPHPVEHVLTGLRESVARIEEELSLSP